MLGRPATRELIVSYGELDCYATLARFPLSAALEATLGRRKIGPPRALLATLVIFPAADGTPAATTATTATLPATATTRPTANSDSQGKDGGGDWQHDGGRGAVAGTHIDVGAGADMNADAHAAGGNGTGIGAGLDIGASVGASGQGSVSSWSELQQLLPLLAQLANSSDASSDESGVRGARQGRRRRGRQAEAPPPPRVMLLLSQRCALANAARRSLAELHIGHTCLSVSWDGVQRRHSDETLLDWAERMLAELRGHSSTVNPRGELTAKELAAALPHDAPLTAAGRQTACTVACAAGEPLVLCRCALDATEATEALESPADAMASYLRASQPQLVFYHPVHLSFASLPVAAAHNEQQAAGRPHDAATSTIVPCLAREHSPSSLLAALFPLDKSGHLFQAPLALAAAQASSTGGSHMAAFEEARGVSEAGGHTGVLTNAAVLRGVPTAQLEEMALADIILAPTAPAARALNTIGLAASHPTASWLLDGLRELALTRAPAASSRWHGQVRNAGLCATYRPQTWA